MKRKLMKKQTFKISRISYDFRNHIYYANLISFKNSLYVKLFHIILLIIDKLYELFSLRLICFKLVFTRRNILNFII